MNNDNLKIGLLSFASCTGLGYQTKEFYDHIKPVKTLICDLRSYNQMPIYPEWYPDGRLCSGFPKKEDCEWLTDGVDVLFVCENPLNYDLFTIARQKRVKIVQQLNYEFCDYYKSPSLPYPDVFAMPSSWGMSNIKALGRGETVYWPVPVNISKIPFRKIEEVKTFVHIGGRPASEDRNGTISFLNAAKQLGHKYNYILYLQAPSDYFSNSKYELLRNAVTEAVVYLGMNLEVIYNCEDNAMMYSRGDVMVLPRRYGGLCLPLWEALSAGMPVIMPRISPNGTNLPDNWLCEASFSSMLKKAPEVVIYNTDTHDLSLKMNLMAKTIKEDNLKARELAEFMSWENQLPIYKERLQKLCK
jgi:glycosyltransferase involved in cell wall biosynthesis